MINKFFNKNTEEILMEVAEITEWYNEHASNLDLDELIIKRNKLSTLAMFLTEATVITGTAAQLDYVKRKVRVAYLSKDYKLSKETDKKVSDAMANNMAMSDCEDLFKKEEVSAGIADRLRHMLRQSNTLLTVFHQMISILQKEKEEVKYYEAIDSRIAEIKSEYDKQLKHIELQYDAIKNRLGDKFKEVDKKLSSIEKVQGL